jgi:hypothetical protein
MRSSFAVGADLPLSRTPSARQQAARRRLVVAAAVVAFAVLSAVTGLLTAPKNIEANSGGEAFSYFPSE